MGAVSSRPQKRVILFFQLFTWLGGGEYGVYDLARTLDRSRFHPVVVFNKRGPFVDKLEEIGVEVVLLPYEVAPKLRLLRPAAIIRNLRASFAVRRFVEQRGIDLIQCSDVLSLMLLGPLLIRRRKPVIFSLIFRYSRSRALLLTALSILGVRRIVSLSQWILDDLNRKTFGLKKRSSLVYWAVDTKKFHLRSSEEKARLRTALGLPSDKRIIGFIGRFDVWKGHLTFLDAAKGLLETKEDLLFLIVGDAITQEVAPAVLRYYTRVMKRVEEHKFGAHLLMWKHRNDIPDVMACCDVFVCPSEHEPFGLVMLEAMASGVPVVASDSGGPVEIIEDGKDGFLFQTGNAEALQSAIARCLDAPQMIPGVISLARKKAETKFTLRNYVESMERIYDEVLAGE